MVEATGAEAGQAAAEETDPDLVGLGIDVDCGNDPPWQAVLFRPRLDLAGLLVVAGEAVFGADPDVPSMAGHGEDMIVGQAVPGGELFPVGVDVGQGRGPGLRAVSSFVPGFGGGDRDRTAHQGKRERPVEIREKGGVHNVRGGWEITRRAD